MTIKEEIDIIMKRLPEQLSYIILVANQIQMLTDGRDYGVLIIHPKGPTDPEYKRKKLLYDSALGVHHNLIERLKFLINERDGQKENQPNWNIG